MPRLATDPNTALLMTPIAVIGTATTPVRKVPFRFEIDATPMAADRIHIMVNWFDELRGLLPAGN